MCKSNGLYHPHCVCVFTMRGRVMCMSGGYVTCSGMRRASICVGAVAQLVNTVFSSESYVFSTFFYCVRSLCLVDGRSQ